MGSTERRDAERLRWLRGAWRDRGDSGDSGEIGFYRTEGGGARVNPLDLGDRVAARDPVRASHILDRIDAGCRASENHPRFGRARSDIGEGARMFVVERWPALRRSAGADRLRPGNVRT